MAYDFVISSNVYAPSVPLLVNSVLVDYVGVDGVQAANGPPLVATPAPALMSSVGASQALSYDVTDPQSNFLLNIVAALLGGSGEYEIVHDGTGFSAAYQMYSTRTPITNGWRYSIRRTAGWPVGSVKLRHWSVDDQGLQNNGG